MKKLLTIAIGDPPSLAGALATRLGVTVEEAREWVRRGAVQVDGVRASDPEAKLSPGARVAAFVRATSHAEVRVVYEDEYLLVVDKPAGLLSQASPSEREALDAVVARTHPEARRLHRLDRDASGLVIFAASQHARAPLQHLLDDGKIDRRYRAVVGGRLDGEGEIRLRIGREARPDRRRALPENDPAGKPARTLWRAIAHGEGTTTVECTLDTGRTHQIRVHLSAIGHPIVGDTLYGGVAAARLHLHAHELRLPHPADGRPLVFSSAVPF